MNWFVRLFNWGCPGGFLVDWAGRSDVFQPMEFLKWEQIIWVARKRLKKARMEMVSVACQLPRTPTGYTWFDITLRVLVRPL